MQDHPNKRPGGYCWIDRPKGAVGAALSDVLANVVFDIAGSRVKEDAGELVSFQRAEQQQAHEGLVFGVKIEHFERQRAEERPIILADRGFLQLGLDSLGALFDLVVEDSGVEFFLACEVPENDGLANSGAFGYLFCGRAAEPAACKELRRDRNNLITSGFAAHSRGVHSMRQ